jgi:hypothetical protein
MPNTETVSHTYGQFFVDLRFRYDNSHCLYLGPLYPIRVENSIQAGPLYPIRVENSIQAGPLYPIRVENSIQAGPLYPIRVENSIQAGPLYPIVVGPLSTRTEYERQVIETLFFLQQTTNRHTFTSQCKSRYWPHTSASELLILKTPF